MFLLIITLYNGFLCSLLSVHVLFLHLFYLLTLVQVCRKFLPRKKKVTVEKAQGPVSQGAWNG